MSLPIVIAAAGRGTRMKELAQMVPKHLIEVKTKPFLYYLLAHIHEAGFSRIIIVTGHLSTEFDKFVQKYTKEFPELETINQYDKTGQEKYGSLMPLFAAQHIVGQASFVMVNGDHLYSVRDLEIFRHVNQDYNYVAATRVTEPSKFGTLVTDDESLLVRIDEKVALPATNLINAGLYRFTPEIYAAAEAVELSPRSEYEITDAITILAKNKKVKIIPLQDYWLDFGRPEDIAVAESIIDKDYKVN